MYSNRKKKHKSEKSSKRSSKHEKKSKHKESGTSPGSSPSSSDAGNGANIGPQLPSSSDIGPQMPSTQEIGPLLPTNADIGPQIGPPLPNNAGIGPQLPPGIMLPSSDPEVSIGPELPNSREDSEYHRQEQPDQPKAAESKPARAGPMLPAGVDLEKLAAMRDKVDWQRLAIEEEEDEEDTIGPAAPGQETVGYMRATAAAEARIYNEMMSQMEAEEQSKIPKHEEWFEARRSVHFRAAICVHALKGSRPQLRNT